MGQDNPNMVKMDMIDLFDHVRVQENFDYVYEINTGMAGRSAGWQINDERNKLSVQGTDPDECAKSLGNGSLNGCTVEDTSLKSFAALGSP